MTILGVIVRPRPADLQLIEQRLAALPGVEVAQPAGPAGARLVVVIEDTAASTAAATLGAIALWPEVLDTGLVYEYSGPDSPAPDDVDGFRDWRRSLALEQGPQSSS